MMDKNELEPHILVEHIVRVSYQGQAVTGTDGITKRESRVISEKVISRERGEIRFSSEVQT